MFTLQLEWIQSLQKIRSPVLDQFIKFFDFFDRSEFFFILIPMIWLNYNWRLGVKIFYLFALSHFVNYSLKNMLSFPRPFHLDPSIGIIQVSGYGFPSGAAQTAILLSSLLILYWNNRWKWFIAVGFAFSLSFSRVYLGVHFPIDIVGGWVVGFFLLGIYLVFFPKAEQFLKNRSPVISLLLQYALGLSILIYFPSKMMKNICACAMGLGTGIFMTQLINIYAACKSKMHFWKILETAFHSPQKKLLESKKMILAPPKTKLEFWIRSTIGISGVFLLHYLGSNRFNLQSPTHLFFLFFTIGLWISFIGFLICSKLTIFKRI